MNEKRWLQFDQISSYLFAFGSLAFGWYSSDIFVSVTCIPAALLWSAHTSHVATTRRTIGELEARIKELEHRLNGGG